MDAATHGRMTFPHPAIVFVLFHLTHTYGDFSMAKMTVARLKAALVELDGGVLKRGSHEEGEREFCALELSSVMRGQKINDEPGNLPDLRDLNDTIYGDKVRTKALLPTMAALWDWEKWSDRRRKKFLKLMGCSDGWELNDELTEHRSAKSSVNFCKRLTRAAINSAKKSNTKSKGKR